MSATALVELLSGLASVGDAEFERLHGAQSLAILHEVQAVLMHPMESELSHVVLWEQFLLTPQEVDSALAGVIQALMAADPVLAEWLAAALERYRNAAGA